MIINNDNKYDSNIDYFINNDNKYDSNIDYFINNDNNITNIKQLYKYIHNNRVNILKHIYNNYYYSNYNELIQILLHPYLDKELLNQLLQKYEYLNIHNIWCRYIIYNQSLDFEFLLTKFIRYNINDVNWKLLSSKVYIKYIHEYINYPWNFKSVSNNPYLTLSFMKKYENKEWDIYILSRNTFINFDIIEYFKHWDWDWYLLSSHHDLTFDIVEKKYCNYLRWNWFDISKNKNMTLKIIEDNKNYPWDINGISLNPNLTFKYLLANMHLHWSWEHISMNSILVNENILINNLNLPWVWTKICKYINLSCNFIINYIKLIPSWNWNKYSSNIYFDFKCLEVFPNVNFNWYEISKNPNITIEIYEKYRLKLKRNLLIENKFEFHEYKIQNVYNDYVNDNYKKILEIYSKYINTYMAKNIISYTVKPYLE